MTTTPNPNDHTTIIGWVIAETMSSATYDELNNEWFVHDGDGGYIRVDAGLSHVRDALLKSDDGYHAIDHMQLCALWPTGCHTLEEALEKSPELTDFLLPFTKS